MKIKLLDKWQSGGTENNGWIKCHLKEILENNHITQKEIAETIGISESYLSYITSGMYIPPLNIAILISKILNKRIEEIWDIDNQEIICIIKELNKHQREIEKLKNKLKEVL